MYPITDAVKALFEAEQNKVLRITGTDKNGVAISITDDDVIIDSFQVDRYSCNGEKLEVGTAIAAQMSMKLENIDGRYDGIVFEGAELFVEVGIADWTQANPTITWVPCGYFTPDVQPRRMTTISITALDRMTNFDAVSPALTPWTTASGEYMTDSQGNIIYFISSLEFPATITNIIKRVALLCNVPFTQSLVGFPNANLVIDQMPVLEQTVTYRNVIQWCAGIMGANAWIDWTGSLRFSWYNNTTNYTSTVDNRYSSDMQENDITITGVSFTNENNIKIVSGTDDYAIDMSGNYLAAMKLSTILPAVNAAVNGFTYRPFQASSINAPYLWPMDIVTFTDKDGNDHYGALTNVTFGLNGSIVLQSKGETAETNSRVKPSSVNSETAQMIERAAQVARNLDESLDQEGIFNRLTDGGEIQGLLLYDGKVYLNASYINSGIVKAEYIDGENLHVKAANIDGTLVIGQLPSDVATEGEVTTITNNTISTTNVTAQNLHVKAANIDDTFTANKIVGGTLTLGGNGNTNGTLTVKDASGNAIGTWNNNGLTLNKGSIAGSSVTLGGNNNTNGMLTVKDASENIIGVWNNNGLSIKAGEINCKLTGGRGNDDSIIINALAGSSAYMAFQTTVTPASNIPRYVNIDSDDGVLSVQDGAGSNNYAAITYLTGRYLILSHRYGYDVTHNLDNYIEVRDLYQDRWTEKPRRSRIRPYSIEMSRDYYDPYGAGETTKQIFFVDETGMVVSGTKSRSVATDQYSNRLLYCYETPTPMFGDIGDGVISDDGFCYVMLDAVFAQTVTTEQYQVFLQKYGPGDCWVKERKGAYFIVEGTPGMSFGWEVKAKQRDYDQLRLERNDEKFTVPTQTYGEDAAKHINDIQKERISA